MKVVILHARPTGTADAISNHGSWLKDLKEEHEGFYGCPHGDINRGKAIPLGLASVRAGFVNRDTALLILLGAGVTEGGDAFTPSGLIQAYKSGLPMVGWLPSGGNLTLVNGPWEYRDGRRHGLRMASATHPDDVVRYIETRCPDENPDSKDLTTTTNQGENHDD